MEIRKISRRRPRPVDNGELDYFTLFLAEDGKEMYKDLQCTCTAVVLPSVTFSLPSAPGLLKFPNI